jgi:2'-5' RNA ligase
MRLFIAFDIDEKFRKVCDYLILKGRKLYPKEIKWVESQNLHFTFLFLGEIERDNLPLIVEMLDVISLPVMDLDNGVLKWNPPFKPQTIWIEYPSVCQELIETHKRFRKELKEKLPDLKLDKKDFKFHLTLGRIKNHLNIEKWQLHEEIFNTTTKVTQITLYESVLLPHGPVYKPIITKTL